MKLGIYNDFDRRPDLLEKFDNVLKCYSAAAVFADVQYRLGVMDSAIKPAFRAKATDKPSRFSCPRVTLLTP